jgi:ABC-type branched-subunit amino acid transport system substrate-binding protein
MNCVIFLPDKNLENGRMRKITILIIVCCVWLGMLTACSTTSNKQETGSTNADSSQEPNENTDTNMGGSNRESDLDDNIPDLTGETIVLYLIGDTEPPFTTITSPIHNAAVDYVEYLNENGGLFGAAIELRFADTGGSEEGAVTAYERFTNDDDPLWMIINYGGYEESLYERVNEDRIPLLTFGLNPDLSDIDDGGYVYRLTPAYDEQFVFFLEFVLDNWEDIKPGGTVDEIKVAYISWDNTYGRSAISEEVRAYAEDLGIEIVLEEYFIMSDLSSTTAALLNAEMAGATVVYTNTHDFGPAILLNDMNNLAIRDFFIVGGNNWAFDASMLDYLFDLKYAEGFYIPSWYAWWTDTENLGIQFADDILEVNGRADADKVIGRLLIQGGLDLACHAIEEAILQTGYENVSSEKIKKALDEISGYEVMNGLFNVDFSGGNHSPTMLQMRQVQGDAGVLVTVEGFSEIPDF